MHSQRIADRKPVLTGMYRGLIRDAFVRITCKYCAAFLALCMAVCAAAQGAHRTRALGSATQVDTAAVQMTLRSDVGDSITVTFASAGEITAITLFPGFEPILRGPGTSELSLGDARGLAAGGGLEGIGQ